MQEEMNKVWHDMKKMVERQETEIKQLGSAAPETKAAIDAMNTRLDEIETKLNRPGTGGSQSQDNAGVAAREAKAAFMKWCKKGILTPEESKALSVSDDTTGGYLAPSEYVNEILKSIVEFSPVRSIARVRTTNQKSVQIPKRTGVFSAAWVSEVGTKSETTGLAYGVEEVPTHELFALVDISQQDLEDSAFNLESELSQEFVEQFGVAEGAAFVTGNAVGKPEGLLTYASVGETVSGAASAITLDGLISIFHDLKDSYARNSTWLLKRSSLKAIRQLKDANGQYLWQPAIANSSPATILDRPYVESIDMPTIAANAYPVLFGDFRRAYTIVDRVQITVQRDPYTQATTGKIRFIARKRVGGQVVMAEAVRKLKVSV
ncbi:MAG: phage major capsid protein [Nitrospirae bacterium]|nr:phage major capsid protein [Nitrospirota bacterium]